MITIGKFFAVLLWIPILIWVGATMMWEKVTGVAPTPFVPGVSFSTLQAQSLGLDPRTTYLAILDDLGAQHIRINAYWPELEPQPGQYDFSLLDFEVKEAEQRGAKVVLAVGMKLPRWPECHVPNWANGILASEREERLQTLISKIVTRYKTSPAIVMWQVENEPFFYFGAGPCAQVSSATVKQEVALVRSLDDRPILITDSGEEGLWIEAAKLGDVVGTTMYRRPFVKNRFYFNYPLPARFYERKAKFIKMFYGKDTLVAEMQAEPWLPSPRPSNFSIERQFQGLDFVGFKQNLSYAKASRLSPVYFWGVEWWYWLRQHGHPEFWNYAKSNLFQPR